MKFFNANAIHNAINMTILLLTALAGFDWTMLGLDPERTLFVNGCLVLAKIVMNVFRDGFAGLVKVQPPVEDGKPDPMQRPFGDI